MRAGIGVIIFSLMTVTSQALATWQIVVDGEGNSTTIYGYADSDGCVAVGSGSIYSIKYFVGEEIEEIRDVNDYFCVPANMLFVAIASPTVTVILPEANVRVEDRTRAYVRVSKFGNRTVVSIDSARDGTDMWILLLLGAVAATAAAGYSILKRREKDAVRSAEEVVIEYVAKHPGCTQKEICAATGMEKYQVSRILSRLEKRGIVVRVRWGISKRVYLKEQLQ